MAKLDNNIRQAQFESSKDLLKVGKVQTSKDLEKHFLDMYARKIYINKEDSVVRELLTNAVDAHIERKSKRAIEVKLPDQMSPTFRVRDFGNGMSEDFMKNKYPQAGLSTKNESNNFAGYMGIGRLSVFSVADEYFVTSIHEGIKSKYALRWEADGVNVYQISSEKSNDPSGVEVEFSVQKNRWRAFQRNIFGFLLTSPYEIQIVNSSIDLYVKAKSTVLFENDKVVIISRKACEDTELFVNSGLYRSANKVYLVNGFVPYPMQRSILKLHREADTLSDNCIILYKVPIGIMNFEPSRERYQVDVEVHKPLERYFDGKDTGIDYINMISPVLITVAKSGTLSIFNPFYHMSLFKELTDYYDIVKSFRHVLYYGCMMFYSLFLHDKSKLSCVETKWILDYREDKLLEYKG